MVGLLASIYLLLGGAKSNERLRMGTTTSSYFRAVILRILLLVILPVTVSAADARVKSQLEQIEAGRLDLRPLAVSYDDLHPLHGGLVLTIHGTRKVEQSAVRQTPGRTKLVPREDLLKLCTCCSASRPGSSAFPNARRCPMKARRA
jgi:hypothetical protein